MKYIISALLLLPIAAFSTPISDENGGDNHAPASQTVGNADSTQGLNLNDQASDSLLWTYPTFSYGRGYYNNYYPYFYNNYYNDVYVLPYHYRGVHMMKHMDKMGHMGKMDMDMAAPMKKDDHKKMDDKKVVDDKKVDKKVDDKKVDKEADDEMTDKE